MSMNLNHESDSISEDELRAALVSYKIDPRKFEAGVRARIHAAEEERANDPLANASPLLRAAASLLPMPLLTGGKVSASAAPLANASGLYKLLAYVAMPAFSLFMILGAAIFGAAGIRRVQRDNDAHVAEQRAMAEAVSLWRHRHRWIDGLLFAITLALAWFGATTLMLLLYLISMGVMLYVLSGFAKLGIGNRRLIGQSCICGLGLLGQVSAICTIGTQDIHFVDQLLIPVIFYCGVMALIPVAFRSDNVGISRVKRRRWLYGLLRVVSFAPLLVWFTNPIWWPTTPERIKSYVESFDKALFSTASWKQWEIPAKWAIESKLDPDLSSPRRLLTAEIAGEQNPFILGTAFRVGLVRADQVGQLREYESRRHALLDDPYHVEEKWPILSLDQADWVIRASVLHNDLSPRDRDHLEKRLHNNLKGLPEGPYTVLETALRVTQLLEVIGRPIDSEKYRTTVHDLLRKFHSKDGGGFQVAGGFKIYSKSQVGDIQATAYAIELMEIYGIPSDLDLNWVRSYLRPMALRDPNDEVIAAVSRDRLSRLPGVQQPTWLDYLYYERSLLMAVLLVSLCIYATLSSPLPARPSTAESSTSAASPISDNSEGKT